MVRRRMTIKRLDPWSMLKFGAVASVVVFAIFMLIAAVVWFIVDRLQLVDQACGIATDIGFTSCGVNAGNMFRALGLLSGMGVIVLTAVLVFASFLYNLISDLTGGLTVGVVEDGVPARAVAQPHRANTTSGPSRAVRDTGPATQAARRVDSGRVDANRADSGRADAGRGGAAHLDPARVEVATGDTARGDARRSDTDAVQAGHGEQSPGHRQQPVARRADGEELFRDT